MLATVVPRYAHNTGWVHAEGRRRASVRDASGVAEEGSSETRSSVTKTLFARSTDDEGRVGTRARRGTSESSASRAFERSFASRDASVSHRARARAAARPPDGSLVQNEMGHRGVRTKRVVSSGEEARGKGTRARIRWTGAYLGMAFSLLP